jgi:tRNA(Ile2) C34 agmatinyltransferase TiaS
LGYKATKTFCLACGKVIDLAPPYLCKACGYSMIHKRYINYPRNVVMPLNEKTVESAMTLLSTPVRVRVLLEMRSLGLVDWEGGLTPEGRATVEKLARVQT